MSENNLCRACLISVEYFQYYLFDNVSPDIYSFCTSIKVTEEEPMPKSLCNVCYDMLIKFKEFKDNCIQSHETLLNKCIKAEENLAAADDSQNSDNDQYLKPKEELDNAITHSNDIQSKFNINEVFNVKNELNGTPYHDNPTFADPLKPSNKIKTERRTKLKIPKVHKISLKCDLCNRTFVSEKKLERHIRNHKAKLIPIRCLPCKKKFKTQCGLKRHNATWHSKVSLNRLKCFTCGKVARSKDTLREHQKLHSDRLLHICNICGKACSTANCLKIHLDIHQENRKRQSTCEYCGKKFFTKKDLSSHISRCHRGRRYICQICRYPFTDKYNLAQHCRNLHEGISNEMK